ncbi:MAG: PQQ-binding-like beta-propeller repeat protein [Planctomycetota bacterium]|jgi:outer membrane protein assembly factor BamB
MGASGRVLVLAVLATSAFAAPDASIAPAGRWTDPRGTAAGNLRSAARPLADEIEERWKLKLPGVAAHPPLCWDGLVHLVCVQAGKRTYLVIDLYAGEVLAKKTIPEGGPSLRPVLWNNTLIFSKQGTQILAYRGSRTGIRRIWNSKPGAYSDPVVWDGEIYVVNNERLERLRPGRNSPVWSVGKEIRGRPAVYGNEVYVVGHVQQPGYYPFVHLMAFDRKSGEPRAMSRLGQYVNADKGIAGPTEIGEISVTEESVFVRTPRELNSKRGGASHAVAPRAVGGGKLVLEDSTLYDYDLLPSAHSTGAICRSQEKEGPRWGRWTQEGIHAIASGDRHPELFKDRVAAAVLGDIVYFGRWAADIRTGQIVWRLDGAKVAFPAVPADGMVLVVDDRRILRAFGERGAE